MMRVCLLVLPAIVAYLAFVDPDPNVGLIIMLTAWWSFVAFVRLADYLTYELHHEDSTKGTAKTRVELNYPLLRPPESPKRPESPDYNDSEGRHYDQQLKEKTMSKPHPPIHYHSKASELLKIASECTHHAESLPGLSIYTDLKAKLYAAAMSAQAAANSTAFTLGQRE